MCCPHYDRWCRLNPSAVKKRGANGTGHVNKVGRTILVVNGKKRLLHVLIAERALGGPLPPGVEVHHIDEDKKNNEPSNLVICPDAAYHKLLHQRQRAFNACGHYDWRKCQFCQKYDDPKNDMWISRKKAYHKACELEAHRAYKARVRKSSNTANQGTRTSHV